MLRLRHREAISRNNDYARSGFQNRRRLFGTRAMHGALLRLGLSNLNLPECAEQHIAERAVHRLAHDDRKDQAARSIERARNHQQRIVQREPIAQAERPAYEFNSAITVGMSAPPIGIISSKPKIS